MNQDRAWSIGRLNATRRACTDAAMRVESFGGCVREELLSVELFSCLAEAQVLIEDWRQGYNHRRPHSGLGMMTPAAFAVG